MPWFDNDFSDFRIFSVAVYLSFSRVFFAWVQGPGHSLAEARTQTWCSWHVSPWCVFIFFLFLNVGADLDGYIHYQLLCNKLQIRAENTTVTHLFGHDSSLWCTWHQLRQAQMGLEEPFPRGWQVVTGFWLGAHLNPWFPGLNSALCVTAWASSQHGVWVPRGRKQKLPDLLHTWGSSSCCLNKLWSSRASLPPCFFGPNSYRASVDSRVESLSSTFHGRMAASVVDVVLVINFLFIFF